MKTQYFRSPVYPVTLAAHDRRWLGHAIRLAAHDRHPRPMAAVAVAGGRLLGEGRNVFRNAPEFADWSGCSFHAEEMLARSTDVSGCTVYVARVTKSGSPGLARPCRRCWSLLHDNGVRKVVFSTPEGASVESLVSFA